MLVGINFLDQMKSEFTMKINKNRTLSKIHLGLALIYLVAGTFFLLLLPGLKFSTQGLGGLAIAFSIAALPAALHLLAMKGAASGTSWGRNLSSRLGFLMLFAFPFGTLAGPFLVYFSRQSQWESSSLTSLDKRAP